VYECPVCGYPGLEVKPYEQWPPPTELALTPPYAELDRAWDLFDQALRELGWEGWRRCT
jgi:hypothetical protein